MNNKYTSIVNFIELVYFSVFRLIVKSHDALSHDSIDQSKLANGNGGHEQFTTVKYFDSLYLAKGILMFALSPTDIHSIAFSVVLSIYLHRKPMEC